MEKITKKHKIAVIEDEEIMSKALGDELEDAGFEVIKASNGEEGLVIILKEKPDLVLLDIVMPKMDGVTMLKKLRTSGEYGKHLPIIILTNSKSDDQIMSSVTKDEPSYYLVKLNHTVADVVAKVKERLKEKHLS